MATACGLAAAAVLLAAPAARADGPLVAGVASVDLTPEPGQRLWGYSNRTHAATGKLDPLMAKTVVLKAGDQSVAIVALDLGRTPEEAVLAKVRSRTAVACGIVNLFVTASHTHHAPAMESTSDSPNPYAEKVGEQIADCISKAAKHLVPVRIGVGRGMADFAHNRRRRLPDGRIAMQWRNSEREPTAPVDKEYAVIRIDRQDGTPLAVLFNYACHPVVLGPDNYEYSADYVGAARALVEEELKTTCLFLQGGCGDINPYMDKTPLDQGGLAEMRKMGHGLGELLVKTARDTATRVPAHPSIQFEAQQIPLRMRWDIEDPEVRSVLSKAYGARFDNYIAKTIKHNSVPCTLTTLVIDGDLALVGMPGEIFVAFQTAIKTGSPVADSFLVGYTNGYHAYFPTLQDAAAGGYGGKTATYVEPGAGERLTIEGLIAIYKMTDKLHDTPRPEDFKLLEYDAVRAGSAGK
ncbi:MAG: neutral/alkaline non-lysosomal ceramidase N-terminal domain-containing protein [Pirellulales bacterium]